MKVIKRSSDAMLRRRISNRIKHVQYMTGFNRYLSQLFYWDELESWIFSQIKAAEERGHAVGHLDGLAKGMKVGKVTGEPLGPGLPVSVGSSEKE